MKVLIDTQVFIWLVTQDARLGQNALELVSDTSNRVFISYFSFFEMTIKASIGKMKLDNTVLEELPAMGIELLMPDVDVLRGYKVFNAENKDPFDNALISVAVHEGLTFITSDHKILNTLFDGLKMIDARR